MAKVRKDQTIYVLLENETTRVSQIQLDQAIIIYSDYTGQDYNESRNILIDQANIGCIYDLGNQFIGIIRNNY